MMYPKRTFFIRKSTPYHTLHPLTLPVLIVDFAAITNFPQRYFINLPNIDLIYLVEACSADHDVS